jgi:hypothetical protein
MPRDNEAAMRMIDKMLDEQYGVGLGDVNEESVFKDVLNGEDLQAIVDELAEKWEWVKIDPVKSNDDRAFRIAVLGKRNEYDANGNKQNPHGGQGIVVPVEDEFGIPRNGASRSVLEAAEKAAAEVKKIVKNAYEDGLCPVCGEPIPDDLKSGTECVNCGYILWSEDDFDKFEDSIADAWDDSDEDEE